MTLNRTALSFRMVLLALLAAAALLPASARAQNNRPDPARPESKAPPGDARGTQPRDPDESGVSRPPVPEGKVTLAFNDVPVDEKIIAFIAQNTNKVVIPVNLSSLKVKKITLINSEPVDRALALDLLLTAMRLNGVGVTETNEVVVIDIIENMPKKPTPVYTANEDIMSLQQRGNFIVKIYRLKEAPAEDVMTHLEENKPDYATLTADPNSNQIILYADVGTAQHMQSIIDELDRSHVTVKTETFRLAYADAQGVADQIFELFDDSDQQNQQAGQRTQRPPRNPQPGQPQQPGALTGPGPVVELRISVNVQQNSVTVQAEPEKIEAIRELVVKEWDLPRPEETARVYVLEHTDPLKVRDLLQSLLGSGGGGTTGRGAQGRTTAPRGAGGTQAGGGGGQSAISEVIGDIYRIEAYTDQNSIVVLSKTKEALDYLDSIIEAIDVPSTVGVPVVVELKHANAVSLAEELNILLAVAGSGGGLERPGSGLTGPGIGGMTDEGGDSGLDAGGGRDTTGGGGAAGGGAGAGTIEFPWQRGRQPDDQSPESSLIGKVRIVPIVRQNALAILAPIAQRDAVRQMIEEFDLPGRQVMISAIIAEVELNDDMALGLRFSSNELTSSLQDLSVGGSVGFEGEREDLFDNLFDTSVLDVNADINVLLQAIRQKTNVRILQEPRVFTADNQEAIFFDGQDVPFITDSLTNNTQGGGLTQSFDYKPVGVQLDVRPRITAERDVDMEINLELSSIVPGETLFGGFILDRRETTTKIIVKNGQTIVLSGILTDSESRITRGIPLLEDIPLIGELFRSHENSSVSTELLAFITPIVVDNPSENDFNYNQKAREHLKDLSQPLKKQAKKHRERIRESISTLDRPSTGVVPAPIEENGDDEGEDDDAEDGEEDNNGRSISYRRPEPTPRPDDDEPVDVDDVNEQPPDRR